MLILDEVMCDMGRTGYLFACEAEGIAPDILCAAKGLGAGYQSIGAMLCSGDIYDTIANGSRFFQHGHTYIGHPVAAAARLAVVNAILDRDLLARVKAMGPKLQTGLADALGQHPHVGDIRGRGLFTGVEIVSDRETKTPFPPDLRIAARLTKAAFENGLVCYPMAGTRDGKHGDHILLAPPFIMTEEQIPEIVAPLVRTVFDVMK